MNYAQLINTAEDEGLARSVRAACVMAAEAIRTELGTTPNHAARVRWARQVLGGGLNATVTQMVWLVLSQNITLTPAQARALTDAQVQTAVNAAVDLLAE